MSALVIVLRLVSLLALAGLMWLAITGRCGRPKTMACQNSSGRAPLAANLAAVAVYLPSLLVFSDNSTGPAALLLASLGSFLAVAGVALVVRSRAELGQAWSLVPKADHGTGFITSGPYRFVRHPIYLGFAMLAMGEALAFGNWPALMIVLSGIGPTFAWRARTEERLLCRIFGERYAVYRQRTKMMIPYLI